MQQQPRSIRISDLPREERLAALYQRAAAQRAAFEAERTEKKGWVKRLTGWLG